MLNLSLQKNTLVQIRPELYEILTRPCRPKILVVADGSLNFGTGATGLSRFLAAVTEGVSPKPILTLAHRGVAGGTVTVAGDALTVITGYNFATDARPVNRTNYDQVWLFGINDSSGALSDPELQVLTEFMNSGGGLFATGDHSALGRAMSGRLPRVRKMREWTSVPMDTEHRIDTINDPGPNAISEVTDQSDGIPQRVYPRYVVRTTATGREATVHPLMMAPGAQLVRNSADDFQFDIDAFPDHPHESVCRAVTSPADLGATYTEAGLNFPEWQPAASGGGRVGAEIVAYGVSGGRWMAGKPPVNPQMFGLVSAYDGRLAQAYSSGRRPGRIVCDSTWHHFVNMNLDGTGYGLGLGTWSAGVFTPSPALLKVYAYFRNIVSWIQPSDRVRCGLLWTTVALRYHPLLVEELMSLPRQKTWRDLVAVGRQAASIAASHGVSVEDLVTGALVGDDKLEPLGTMLTGDDLVGSDLRPRELAEGLLGRLLVRLADAQPLDRGEVDEKALQSAVEGFGGMLGQAAGEAFELGFEAAAARGRRLTALADAGRKLLTRKDAPPEKAAAKAKAVALETEG